jgi:molecular chaperone HtpG
MVENSPFVEKLTKKGWEVLYLVEPIDEYMLQNLKEYNEKSLLCVTKSDIDFGDTDEEKTKNNELGEKYKGLCSKIQEILGESIEKVIVSNRITDSPCCIVTGSMGMSANMERIIKAQAMAAHNPMQFMMNKKTFEINPDNKIITAIYNKFSKDEHAIKDMIWLLYDTAILDSGFSLDRPHDFSGRIHRIMSLGLGVDDDEDDDEEIDIPLDNELEEDVQINDDDDDGDMETID